MYHQQRWTLTKIRQRLDLVEPLVYLREQTLPAFRYKELNGPQVTPPVGAEVDDSGWREVQPYQYWGSWLTDFVLRTTFKIPED